MPAADHIATETLQRLIPFASLSSANLADIQKKGRCERFPAGTVLFKRGESSSELHYLLTGAVDLTDAHFEVVSVAGDASRARHALDDHVPHELTAVTTTEVELFLVPKDHVDLVLTWDQAGDYMVTDLADGDASHAGDWMSSLLSSSLFTSVPPTNIQQLFAKFEEVRVPAGKVVIRQGEPGDYFYVIKQGRCRVTRMVSRGGERKEVTLAELGAGQVFGEDALIGDTPRNATITMLSDGALMRLGKEDFQTLLQNPVLEYLDYQTLPEFMDNSARRVVVLDVRLPGEFEQARLPQSRNLPLQVLRENLARLDPEAEYVVTCDGGRRSMLAAYLLSQHGFDARVLKDPPNPPPPAH